MSFDEKLTEESVIEELRDLAGIDEDEEDEDDPESGQKEAIALEEEATIPIEELMKRYGDIANKHKKALEKDKTFQSPALRPKKDLETNDTKDETTPPEDQVKITLDSKLINGHSENEKDESKEKDQDATPEVNSSTQDEKNSSTKAKQNDIENTGKEDTITSSTTKEEKNNNSTSLKKDSIDEGVSSTENNVEKPHKIEITDEKDKCDGGVSSTLSEESSKSAPSSAPTGSSSSSSGSGSSSSDVGGSSSAGGSSSSAGGSSSGSGSSSSADAEAESVSSSTGEPCSSSGRTKKGRKNIIPADDEDESSAEETDEEEEEDEDFDEDDEDEDEEGNPWEDDEDDEDDEDEEDGVDDGINMSSNGEEPGFDSGCTAVVALLQGKELYVANSGDSRCVVCREGKAVDMSVDHKPEDEVELKRIVNAGGRVTTDGRVNGGLNLSRAIGDHHYKKNTELPAKEQMISAFPDVRCLTLDEKDEFMVLACDGIWNVMTSQDVCNFVSERLKETTRSLSSICEEMFDFCLAPDSMGDGTGCDNMTCIIVTFDNVANCASDTAKRRASTEPESQEQSQAKRQKTEEDSDK